LNRDLSGEGTEIDQFLPPPEVTDFDALRYELARLRTKLDTLSSPGWDIFEAEWTAAREQHYRNLAAVAVNSMEAISLMRGEVVILEQLLRKRAEVRNQIDVIEQQLADAEPETQEA